MGKHKTTIKPKFKVCVSDVLSLRICCGVRHQRTARSKNMKTRAARSRINEVQLSKSLYVFLDFELLASIVSAQSWSIITLFVCVKLLVALCYVALA